MLLIYLKNGFIVSDGQTLSLKNINLTRFNYPAYSDGGAIYNSLKNKTFNIVSKDVSNISFVNNTATGDGGAIYNSKGTLSLTADNLTKIFDVIFVY